MAGAAAAAGHPEMHRTRRRRLCGGGRRKPQDCAYGSGKSAQRRHPDPPNPRLQRDGGKAICNSRKFQPVGPHYRAVAPLLAGIPRGDGVTGLEITIEHRVGVKANPGDPRSPCVYPYAERQCRGLETQSVAGE